VRSFLGQIYIPELAALRIDVQLEFRAHDTLRIRDLADVLDDTNRSQGRRKWPRNDTLLGVRQIKGARTLARAIGVDLELGKLGLLVNGGESRQ
jgi:hypothetical protein